MDRLKDKICGALAGLACGDAVGTTLEFQPPGTFEPITDMVGGGPFFLKKGQWTDDTSMALCLGASLLACNGMNAADQMDRYLRWRDQGYYSSTGHCFDIGGTVSAALMRYKKQGDPYAGATHARSAGNGALMRLAPVPMFFLADPQAACKAAIESSRTTHGAAECLDANVLYTRMLMRAMLCDNKASVLNTGYQAETDAIAALSAGSYQQKSVADLTGSGYVVESLEAALWCFARTDSYRDAVLQAANLGNDADTTAAIVGQLAGAFYGRRAIPADWLAAISLTDEIVAMAQALADAGLARFTALPQTPLTAGQLTQAGY